MLGGFDHLQFPIENKNETENENENENQNENENGNKKKTLCEIPEVRVLIPYSRQRISWCRPLFVIPLDPTPQKELGNPTLGHTNTVFYSYPRSSVIIYFAEARSLGLPLRGKLPYLRLTLR